MDWSGSSTAFLILSGLCLSRARALSLSRFLPLPLLLLLLAAVAFPFACPFPFLTFDSRFLPGHERSASLVTIAAGYYLRLPSLSLCLSPTFTPIHPSSSLFPLPSSLSSLPIPPNYLSIPPSSFRSNYASKTQLLLILLLQFSLSSQRHPPSHLYGFVLYFHAWVVPVQHTSSSINQSIRSLLVPIKRRLLYLASLLACPYNTLRTD